MGHTESPPRTGSGPPPALPPAPRAALRGVETFQSGVASQISGDVALDSGFCQLLLKTQSFGILVSDTCTAAAGQRASPVSPCCVPAQTPVGSAAWHRASSAGLSFLLF